MSPRIDQMRDISYVSELLGQKRPKTITRTIPRVRHCMRCQNCGGMLLETYVERTGRNAYLHDFERLAWVCEECGEVAP